MDIDRRSSALIFASIALVSCKRTPAASDAARNPPTEPTASVSGPSAVAPAVAASEERVRNVARRWNEAHAKKDAHALEDVYAESVSHYGTKTTRATAVRTKAAAFDASPDFTQSIGTIDVEPALGNGAFAARFAKTVTRGGKTKDYPALLVVRDDRVVEENDDVDWCLAADGSGTTDRLVMPFAMSAAAAVSAARETKHFKAANLKRPGLVVDTRKGFGCAKVCPQHSLECGFHMRTSDLDATTPSNLVEWLYVDPVQKKLWFYDLDAMEKSPDRGEIWRSEALPAK